MEHGVALSSVFGACRRLLEARYGVLGRRWIIDPEIVRGASLDEAVERWFGRCTLSVVSFELDMFCTPDRCSGDVLLLDLRTGLAVADKVTLARALAKGGASPGGVLELLEP